MSFWIFITVIALLVLYIISIHNSLIAKRNQVANIEAGVDAQLKRRYDLLPNLIATAQQYLVHEKELLEQVTVLRTQAKDAKNQEQKFELSNKLSYLMPNLQVAFEAYPELKANENILNLQESLNEIEEQISAARRAYNAAVESYNNAVEMFPSNLVANSMHFKKAVFFDIPQEQSEPHNVQDLFTHER